LDEPEGDEPNGRMKDDIIEEYIENVKEGFTCFVKKLLSFPKLL